MSKKRYGGHVMLEVAEVLPEQDMDNVLQKQLSCFLSERVKHKLKGGDESCQVTIVKAHNWRGVQENECEDYSEIELQVHNSKPFMENLLFGIRRFFESVNTQPVPIPQYHKCNLIVHNLDFFSTRLICVHPKVGLDAIYYGNLQGGVFLNHWETSFHEERNAIRNKDSKTSLPHMNGDFYHYDPLIFDIQATFEYDKNDIITIQLCNREKKQIRNKDTFVNMYYKLQVKSNSIRRVIWDLNGESRRSDVSQPVVRLFLDLNCPPFIENGFLTDSALKESSMYVKYTRQLKIRRGKKVVKGKDQWPYSNSVLPECPIFALEFSPDPVKMDTIYQIMSRIRHRTGFSMEFGTYSIVDCICLNDVITDEIKEYLPPLSLIKPEMNTPYHSWTLSRVSNLPDDIRSKPDNKHYIRLTSPTHWEDPIFKEFIENTFQIPEAEDDETEEEREQRKLRTSWIKVQIFSFTYLIECLLSRGSVVKDQLLLNLDTWLCFLQMIYQTCTGEGRSKIKNTELCEAALEDLINMIDSRKRVGSIIKCFGKIIARREKAQLTNGLSNEEKLEGFQRVRKVIITPTRIIYLAPETIMGNRVLRRHDNDGTRILRITFRDDDNQKMRGSKTSENIINDVVDDALHTGIHVAGRHFGYLGSSNSQMRDSGAYFIIKYTGSDKEAEIRENPAAAIQYNKFKTMPNDFNPFIKRVREKLGKFDQIESVPKLMARLGQCFTQSRLSGVELKREKYTTTFDIIGGRNSNGEEFTFSDGCGMISVEFAKNISKAMKLGAGNPSCFQIRFRGIKGVAATNPELDERTAWAAELQLPPPEDAKSSTWSLNCVFRPSQIKFISSKTLREQLEMVKFSSPVPVSLNKPFINILDQVSEAQSFATHRRICHRIEELLDLQMRNFARFILDEAFCRNKLKEFPKRIDIDTLAVSIGFSLSAEPFFRSLIKASIKAAILKQLRKEQVPILFEEGRSMLGVVDETGRLQYGQVFVRYTKSIHLKLPPDTATRIVLNGPVLLTKNPCIVPGDVRMFQAVDIPELYHHCDVIVFPQSGPRPHPDEMAGSDLDGDEYSVIWDPNLFIDYNEPAFDFASEKVVTPSMSDRDVEALMRQHYIKYLKLDAVGTIANNHLHQSDQYGLYSEIAMRLAKKNCEAVDFTKTGKAPDGLRYNWTTIDEETVDGDRIQRDIPPERAERVPDFHFGNDVAPVYVSPRLTGSLFRELKAVDDVMKINEEVEERVEVKLDAEMEVNGWEEYRERAASQLAKYNSQLRAIMENYGIRNEAELFSGCIVEVRNRISDKDQDDMSYFNTNQAIETKMHNLYRTFREDFFEEFGRNGWKQYTEKLDKTYADEGNVFHRICKQPNEEMMKKAVAYYRVCYEEAQRSPESKKLSFAWLAADVLAVVKKHKSYAKESHASTRSPIFDILDNHRLSYIEENAEKYADFLEKRIKATRKQKEDVIRIITRYTQTYPGLEGVLFILLEWADRCNLFKKSSSFREHHLCLLFILFITNYFETKDPIKVHYETDIFLPFLSPSEPLPAPEALPIGRASRITLSFFEFLSSRAFRRLTSISFSKLGFLSVFSRGQWLPLHQSGIKTYYNILFNLRFEELPLSTDPPLVASAIVREHESLVIELPESVTISNIEQVLLEATGLEQVKIRKCEKTAFRSSGNADTQSQKNHINKYLLSSRGTLEAFYLLKKIISVRIQVKTSSLTKELSTQLAQLTYDKITNVKNRDRETVTVPSSLW